MSLTGKKLQAIDTMDLLAINLGTGGTMFSGYTSKAALSQKVTGLDLYAGIGGAKISRLNTKKEIDIDATIVEFDMNFIAALNGVALDTTSTGTYYLNMSFPITTLAATITGATRVIAVRDAVTGDFLKIVSGTPAAINEIKVTGATGLTFFTGYAPTTCLVSYEGVATTGKDNYTIVFNTKAFPASYELLLKTIAFDGDSQVIAADVTIDFYKCALAGDYTLSFEMGKNIELPVKFSILVPSTLPSGLQNLLGDIGVMKVTER